MIWFLNSKLCFDIFLCIFLAIPYCYSALMGFKLLKLFTYRSNLCAINFYIPWNELLSEILVLSTCSHHLRRKINCKVNLSIQLRMYWLLGIFRWYIWVYFNACPVLCISKKAGTKFEIKITVSTNKHFK